MKEQILELRNQGKTYREIRNILNCSLATISYHCGNNQKEKTLERSRKNRSTIEGTINKKISQVFNRKVHDALKYRELLTNNSFIYNKEGKKEFIQKCIDNPVCYWTGVKIDLLDTKSYEFDHYIPVTKGGENSYNNLVLSSKIANRMKHDLLAEEFLELCRQVLKVHSK